MIGCTIAADGKHALSAVGDTLMWWDMERAEARGGLVGHMDGVNDCAIAANGTRALSASEDGTLVWWI